MEFETKNIELVGVTKTVDANTSSQMIKLIIGVVGCPYADIISNKVIKYTFANSQSMQEIKDGIIPFATNWVAANYPAVTGATS